MYIDCPECEEFEGAYLWQEGSSYAGVWECDTCGACDFHEHSDYRVETITVDCMRGSEPDQYEIQVYVCGGCGVTIEGEYPEEDRAEALADMQIMEARGK